VARSLANTNTQTDEPMVPIMMSPFHIKAHVRHLEICSTGVQMEIRPLTVLEIPHTDNVKICDRFAISLFLNIKSKSRLMPRTSNRISFMRADQKADRRQLQKENHWSDPINFVRTSHHSRHLIGRPVNVRKKYERKLQLLL